MTEQSGAVRAGRVCYQGGHFDYLHKNLNTWLKQPYLVITRVNIAKTVKSVF